jgi:adenosylcobinamide-GDP ribazoletransferase
LLRGGGLWLLERAASPLGARLASLLLVAAWAVATGALHLDGLADTVDGLSGGRGDRERSLAIMRDSRIGAHGATALVLALALKWAALEQVLALGPGPFWVAPVVARFVCTLLLARFRYARPQGLGSAFAARVGWREVGLGSLALAPLAYVLGVSLLGPALWGMAVAFGLALWARARLGGLTGDVHGAAVELCEIGVLFGLCVAG